MVDLVKENIKAHLNNMIAYHSEERKKLAWIIEKHPNECLPKIDYREHNSKISIFKAMITNIDSGVYDKENFQDAFTK
jgi:hypothetical protein